jgi:hypothetical protein
MAIVTATDKITALYVGYFDRAPDPQGLSYWVGRFNAGMSLNDIANSFATQPETLATYSYLAAPNIGGVPAAQDFINSIYENLFNRAADAPGLAYWTAQLVGGAVSPGLMIEAIIGGAQNADATIMNNKVAVGEAYANAFVAHNDTWTADDMGSAHAALAGGSVFGANYVQVDATQGSVDTNNAQTTALTTALQTNPHQIVLTPSAASVNSGGGVDYVLTEAPSMAGKSVQYTITGVSASEVAGGQLSGTVTLNSQGQATIHVGTEVLPGNLGTGNENMGITTGGISSPTVTVDHGDQTVSSVSDVHEGSTFNVTIGTSLGANAAGLIESYTVTGNGLTQIPVADRTGTVTLDSSGQFVLNLHTQATVFNSTAADPTITVTVNGVSTTVTINEVAQQSITASDIVEGQQATFNIATTGVAGAAVAGTVETWTLTGDSFVLSQLTGATSGSITLAADGTAAVSVGTSFTVFNLGGSNSGELQLNLFNNGAPVTSQAINVTEATLTVSTSSTPVLEGQLVTFTISGTNVPNGYSTHYTLSGDALGNVIDPTSGTVTINGDTATITVHTTSNDISGATKGLTLTLDTIPTSDTVNLPVQATANIAETAPASYILTTGTDVFPGNPSGDNTYIATAGDAGATLGQNDQLNGGGNVAGHPNTLFLTTTGTSTLNVSSFSTQNIQVFNINASNSSSNGSSIDMSSAQGVETVVDQNSSGTIRLLNVQNQVALNIINPSDLGHSVDVGLQYVGGQLANVNNSATGQVINLDPTVSPITGMPNTIVNMPGVVNFTINSNGPGAGNNSAGFNGLASLNQPLQNGGSPFNNASPLANVTIVGASVANGGALGYVNGGFEVDQPGMVFTNTTNSTNTSLNLAGLNQIFYNVGDPDPATFVGLQATNSGTFTITGGAGDVDPNGNTGGQAVAMQSSYYNPFGNLGLQNGGSGFGTSRATILDTSGSVQINIDSGSFWGQQVRDSASGGSVTISGINGGAGGFVDDVVNAATIKTNSGSVFISGINGGLGSVNAHNPNGTETAGSFIITNTNQFNGGFVSISGVNGGINERFSTGSASAQINESGATGNILLDFSQLALLGLNPGQQTGFHSGDSFTGGADTNTLIVNPNYNNNSTGEGSASGIQNLILQSPSGLTWSPTAAPNNGGGFPTNSFDVGVLGNPTNVFIGGNGNTAAGMTDSLGNDYPVALANLHLTNATFTGAASSETFFVDTFSTNALTGQIFGFDFNGSSDETLNLTLQNGTGQQSLTVRDFDTSNNNNDPVKVLNFTSNTGSNTLGTANLTIDTLNSLTTLALAGSSAFVLSDTATQAASITTITQNGNSNVDLRGLMTQASTGAGYIGTGNGNADALSSVGGTITLGNGFDQVAVGKGSWTIMVGGANSTIVVNPAPGNTDTVTALGGGVTITVGATQAVGGQTGIVDIKTSNDSNLVIFDQSALNLTSADKVDMLNGAPAPGNDTVQIINGALNVNDSVFYGFKGVDNLSLAAGFSNTMVLDVLANLNAQSLGGGIFNINTGGNDGVFPGSTVITGGPGYTSALQVHVAPGGDLGGDTINMANVTNGALTVHASVSDYMTSFETSALTIQGTKEGVFANPANANVVDLTADNTTAVIDSLGSANAGTHGVQTIVGVADGFNGMGVILPAAAVSTEITTVDLSAVNGATAVFGINATQNLTLTGSGVNAQGINVGSNTLVGGSGSDTITANTVWSNGGGVLTPKDFIWGGLGADNLTGVGGKGNTGTDFVYNTKAEVAGDVITNFHGTTDTLFLNPGIFVAGTSLSATAGGLNYVGSGATYADALQLLVGSGTGAGNLTEAVYEVDTSMLWVDLDNNGQLNASDLQIHLNWGSPPAIAGTKIALNVADFNAQDGTSGLFYNGTNVVPALVFPNANPINIPEWNWFQDNGALIGSGQTAVFVGAGGKLTTDPGVSNYNFSAVTSGVEVTTPAFSGGTVMGTGTITGTGFDDKFFVNNQDLTNGLLVNGGDGIDQITIDPPGGFNLTITSAMVQNVETLNLVDPLGDTISFGDNGTGIKNINGSTGPDVINTLNMSAGGTIDLTNGGGDTVNLGADLPGTTIKTGGFTTVNMNYTGALTTTLLGGFNSDLLVLNAGNNDYDISGAAITNVPYLDASQIKSHTVTVAPGEIGGTTGFTNIKLSGNSGEVLKIGQAGTADFTNVTLSSTNFTLSEVAGVTAKMHVNQLPTNIFGDAGGTDKQVFVDASGTVDVTSNNNYTNLGTIQWNDTLKIDSDNSNHGIVGLVGDNNVDLVVTGSMDLTGITTFTGINQVDNVAALAGTTLTMNGSQVQEVGAFLSGNLHASGFLSASTLNVVADNGSYDFGHTLIDNGGLSAWTSLNLDSTNVNGITVTGTETILPSTVTTITGGTGNTDSLVINGHDDTNLSAIGTKGGTFSGFENVTVNDVSAGHNVFHVDDIISAFTDSHSGAATMNLHNNSGDTAWLDTSAASVQTSYTSTGKDTHWDINGFNGGSDPTHSILEVRDTTTGGGGKIVSGADFINTSGQTVSHSQMNVISGALAPVTNLTDLSNNGTVETAIATNAGLVSDGHGVNNGTTSAEHIYVTLYGAGPSAGEAGIYEVVFDATAGHLTNGTTFAGHTGDFSVNLIGIVHNTAQDSLQPVNFH